MLKYKYRKDVYFMKVREFFQNFFVNVKNGISRYFIAFICTVVLFLTLSYEILFEPYTEGIIGPLCMTCALTGIFSVFLKSIQEYLTEKLNLPIQIILSVVTAITGFILIYQNYESLYTLMAYTGIIIALLCFIFFVLMRGENRDTAFPKLVSSAIFTAAICTILSIGISLCIWAFQSLILYFDDGYKMYLIVNLFVWAICYPNIFLSFIPKKDIPTPQSKIFRIFVLFAGLPLYLLLISILLIYLAKIVITWNMPVGEINWFASFASLFFIFFVMSVMQYSEKFAKLFVRFGGYFLIPVLIVQAIAVFERINAYGLTTPRTVSLVLIVLSILFIGGTIITPKHLNKIALASGILVLAVTVTPFNVIDMPVASQTAILENVLLKNNMIKDGCVIPGKNVSDDDAEMIISSYNYLKYHAKQVPEFIPYPKKEFSEIFGFSEYQTEKQYLTYTFQTKSSVDITEYDKMVKVTDVDYVIRFDHNGKTYEINSKELALELSHQYDAGQNELELYPIDENVALYIDTFFVDLEDDSVSYCNFSGYALLKD